MVLSPGLAGPPDSGVIVSIPQTFLTVGGQPLATVGSICQMVNSVSGVPYSLPIAAGGSTAAAAGAMGLIRLGDQIPIGPLMLTILGPPAAPFITDGGAP